MRSWVAIANPHAGAFRYGDFAERWMPAVSGRVARVLYTEGPGHASELSASLVNGEAIAVVGGDGTLMEVVEGLAEAHRRLAVIPAGRGNCLARDLGVRRIADSLDTLANGVEQSVDLMRFEIGFADGGRRSCGALSTSSIGYVTDVVANAPRFLRLGRLAYAAAAVVTRPRRFAVEIDDGSGAPRRCNRASIVINNTAHMANFRAFPRARLDDGELDVMELDAGWVAQMLHNLSVFSQTYWVRPSRQSRCRRLRLRLDTPAEFMIDGEIIADVIELEVRCEPDAARVLRRPR